MSVPALLCTTAFFGYHGLYGERGYVALTNVNATLAERHARLAQLTSERQRLEHRIDLLKAGDPDLVEELARKVLMDGAPGQVAVKREPH